MTAVEACDAALFAALGKGFPAFARALSVTPEGRDLANHAVTAVEARATAGVADLAGGGHR